MAQVGPRTWPTSHTYSPEEEGKVAYGRPPSGEAMQMNRKLSVWILLARVWGVQGLERQVSDHATVEKKKSTSLLKAFYSSTRLQSGFGELHPVTANCCWGDTASHYWRSSDCWSDLRGQWILTFRKANLGEGREAMLSAVLQNKSERQSWNWRQRFWFTEVSCLLWSDSEKIKAEFKLQKERNC